MENIKYSLSGSFGVIQNREQKNIAKTDDLSIKAEFILPNEYRDKDKYKITISNGNLKKQLSLENLLITIPQEFIIAGELKIVVSHLLKGRISKSWICESLFIIDNEVDTTTIVKIVPELTQLESRLLDCENAISQLNDYLKSIGNLGL